MPPEINETTTNKITDLQEQIAEFRALNDPDLVVAIEALEVELAGLLVTQERTDPSLEEPTNNQPDTAEATKTPAPATVNQISQEEFELLQQLKAEKRTWEIDYKIAAMGSEYQRCRNTLASRRVIKKFPDFVPKQDVLAFAAIHALKSKVKPKPQKVYVYESEIKVYRRLEDAGSVITLATILEIAKALPKEEVDEDIDEAA